MIAQDDDDDNAYSSKHKTKPAWHLHGFDDKNSGNASSVSKITKDNVHKLKVKWIYTIPDVPLGTPENPLDNPRGENASSQHVAVDKKGIVYVPTNDGRILVLDSFKTVGANLDGSAIPKLVNTFDLFSDPEYSNEDFDGFISRLHASIVGNAVYAGNHKFFNPRTAMGAIADRGAGTSSPTNLEYISQGAVLYKIHRKSGKLLWKSVIDDNHQSMISLVGITPVEGGPGEKDNLIIIGFTSAISGTIGLFPATDGAPDPFSGTCCNSRGGLAAVRESDGKLIWKTYSMPQLEPEQNAPNALEIAIDNGSVDGWTGGSIWSGGNFPVSHKHRLVYAGTGQAFTSFDAADECEQTRLPVEDRAKCLAVQRDGTLSSDSFGESIQRQTNPIVNEPKLPLASAVVAYDYDTGEIKWAHPLEGFDVWNAACVIPFNFSPFCPVYLRDPFDIVFQLTEKDRDAANPILIEGVEIDGELRDIVLGMSKGTTLAAYDAETGAEIWRNNNAFGPGGINGDGFIFGKATDGKRFYANTGSSSALTLAQYQDPMNPAKVVPGSCDVTEPGGGFNPETGIWGGGMYVAVNLDDGSLAWQRCAIGKAIDPVLRLATGETSPARSTSAVTYANGIVYMPGASSRIPLSSVLNEDVVAEVILFDAEDGTELRTLELGVPDTAQSSAPNYQRPVIVGDRLYLSGGTKRYNGMLNPTQIYNRVVMYQLESDKSDDDNDEDD